MSKKRNLKRSKIKRTSSYLGYKRYRSSSFPTGSRETGLGKAVAMSLAVVIAASLIMLFCSVYIPKLADMSKKSFVSPSESSASESSAPSRTEENSKEESSELSEKNEAKTQESKTEESKKESSETESSEESKADEAEPYLDGEVLIYKNIGYKLFDGSDENAEKYADALNGIVSALDSSINVYSIIAPTHGRLTLGELQKENADEEEANLELIKSKLSDRIAFVDTESVLKEKTDEYIYYNTDEGWTSLGAYYAYKEFCSKSGLTASDFSDKEKAEIDGFSGGLVALTKTDENKNGNADLLSNPDKVEYYKLGDYECGLWESENSGEKTVSFIKEAADSENARDVFCYGDVSLFKIYTGKETGRRLCVVKDSFGSELAPYFTENFDEVHVIDARLFDGSLTGYCYNHEITDVLFVNGINTANTEEQIDALSDME